MPAIVLALAASACAHMPPDGPERALYYDLRKAVELRETAESWFVDRIAVDELAGHAMRSGCRTPEPARDQLRRWLHWRIQEEGGSARSIYERTGDLGDAQESLSLERVEMLLAHADAHIDDCPFWIDASEDFSGIQATSDRVPLILESMGGGGVFIRGDTADLGGFGGGRALGGWGFSQRFTLATGLEIGGTGELEQQADGGRSLDAAFTAAVPLLFRFRDFGRYYDIELAATTRFFSARDTLPPGGRISFGLGLSTMRSDLYMPHGLLWVGYEIQPAYNGDLPQHIIMIGTRVGVSVDLRDL